MGYLWRTVLRRRSQDNHLPWHRMKRYIARWFPPARVCHPYPLVRLGVFTLRWEPDAVLRLSGSVERVMSDHGPYSDLIHVHLSWEVLRKKREVTDSGN